MYKQADSEHGIRTTCIEHVECLSVKFRSRPDDQTSKVRTITATDKANAKRQLAVLEM